MVPPISATPESFSPASSRIIVVFPAPLRPTKPTFAPWGTVKETGLTRERAPILKEKS